MIMRQRRRRPSPYPQQPATDTADLSAAIREFEAALPGWWWSVCVCSVSRDASCAPDRAGPDAALLDLDQFDAGFHRDDKRPNATLASSLREVMCQALAAKRKVAGPTNERLDARSKSSED